ncbi:calcium-binding protein, partial [Calothrix sp. CCY 0018]|uniref:calcium-binding protein n=1 Tax=Calothrix sp. CCY 0018 TaxID=3103864 RepID=UPI0039C6D38B
MNSYKFDFDNVFNQLIEEGGKTRVIYINGIRTTEDKYRENIIGFDNIWQISGNLYEPQKDVYSSTKGLIELDTQYRNTTDSTGNNWGDVGVFALKFLLEYAVNKFSFSEILEKANKHKQLAKKIKSLEAAGKDVTQLAKDLDFVRDGFEIFEVVKTGYELAQKFLQSQNPIELVTKDDNFTAKALIFIKDIANFIPGFGEISTVIDSLIEAAPDDIKEALEQYWYRESKFQNINDSWTKESNSWLSSSSQNSLILLGHSQGNFFLEDGLIDMDSPSDPPQRTRVLALGSPTSYLYAGGLDSYKGESVLSNNIKNPGDPVHSLQFESEPNVWDKIFNIFSMAPNILGLGKEHLIENYFTRPEVITYFKNTVYELHPKGFYFPKGTFSQNYTDDDDWIEGDGTLNGGGRNDVLRGDSEENILIGGEGYDLLDGQGGTDTANYSSSPKGIKVRADKVAGSDVYKVEDGFDTVDTLGNIEVIKGSNFNDEMIGGEHEDTFYGEGGDDKLYGKEGDDRLEGNDGNDWLEGGTGNDNLYGQAGDDKVYGNEGDDRLEGGD